MIGWNPAVLLLIGFVLLITGFALPVLMIMQYLESTFLLNLIAYLSSVIGLILGLAGAILIVVRRRKH